MWVKALMDVFLLLNFMDGFDFKLWFFDKDWSLMEMLVGVGLVNGVGAVFDERVVGHVV
jgi:hypothetical protein